MHTEMSKEGAAALHIASAMKCWVCVLCGFVYDEKAGIPSEGIAPGTPWADVPEDWVCPDCGAGKTEFEMTEF